MSVQHSHMWPFQVFTQNESTAFLVRPYIYANLYDRLSTRPFLNKIEKVWSELLTANFSCSSLPLGTVLGALNVMELCWV